MDDKYITILEAANQLGLTKNAVRGRIQKLNIETVKGERGVILIPRIDLPRIRTYTQSDAPDTQPYAVNTRSVTASDTQSDAPHTHLNAPDIRTDYEAQIKLLNDLIAEKDRHIESLQKNVSTLTESLLTQQRLLENQQKLSLMAALPDTAASDPVPEAEDGQKTDSEPKKRSLIDKILHRD